MGTKGNKATAKGTEFIEALLPRLEILGEVSTKSMFGGYGIFQDKKMFALITSRAELFLKVDDSNREFFTKEKSLQHGKMPYFQVPVGVFESNKKLLEWAKKSIEIAHG